MQVPRSRVAGKRPDIDNAVRAGIGGTYVFSRADHGLIML
jgi:hypothetical protein